MSEDCGAFHALGPVLRDLRIDRGVTQEELARRSRASKSMISLYESGKRRPHLETLEKLLAALDVDLAELALRLEATGDSAEPASSRRGPKGRSYSAHGSGEVEAEAITAVIEVFREVAALLRSSRPRSDGHP